MCPIVAWWLRFLEEMLTTRLGPGNRTGSDF